MNIIIQVLFALVDVSLADKVLLVAMDGFRWDYIQNATTPNFDQMAKLGSKAPYITSTFTTQTFPCLYSIATGLYQESHGILSNRMYDPEFDEHFSMRTKESKWWDKGEPIWVTARKHGKNSAVYFWPGSETEIRGYRPNIWMPYNYKVPADDRVDTVISWLQNDSLQIDLALLYFEEPDLTGHKHGPFSRQVRDKVEEMDGVLGSIMTKLDNAGLNETVNVILTSNQGMSEVDPDTWMIDLSRYINPSSIKFKTFKNGPVINLTPQEGLLDELYANLTKVQHMRVYRKEDIPDRWHYKNNRRTLPLLLVADDGWLLTLNGSYRYFGHGNHGYDNQLMSMKPIFYAKGPCIKKNYVVKPFNSVDIYPFICKLLGIQPSPNNGSLNIIQRIKEAGNSTGGASCSADEGGTNGGAYTLVPKAWLLICIIMLGDLFKN